jgi:hypothetical protein
MTNAEFRPFEIVCSADLERRTALLIATTTRHQTKLWVLDRLWQSQRRQMAADRAVEDQTAGIEIGLIESFALAWYILRRGMVSSWERAKLRLGVRRPHMSPAFRHRSQL